MKFAILGTDSDVLALAAAAVADRREIVWLGDVRPMDEPALRQWTSLRPAGPAEWLTLLDHATADGVIVGRGAASDELRAEQLKRLVTDAVPLLVVHPAGPSLLVYYELDMVRRETGAILRHFNPLIANPLVADLARWVRDGHESIGTIVQVTCARHVTSGAREAVLDGLARDAELLAAAAGDIHRVSAIGPRSLASATDYAAATGATGSASAASYASLQVQMTTGGPATLRWSVVPMSDTASEVELTLVGEKGSIVWKPTSQEPSVESREPELVVRLSTLDSQLLTLPPYDAPATAIRQFVDAIEQSSATQQPVDLQPASTWDKATRAIEVVDAVELSLQKGRTIEVYQQQLTEQLAFRGTMAALGCGLLLLGLLVMVVAGVAGGADWILQRPVMRSWPIVVLAVLAFFLLLQLVPWLAAGQKAQRRRNSEATDE